MAETGVLKNSYLSVNAVDLSGRLRSLSVDEEVEAQDDTAMPDTARSSSAGLKVNRLSAVFNQDYAASGAGSVDATLNAALGTVVAIEWRPDAGAVSTTNPKRTGNLLITRYPPIGQAVGDQATASLEGVGVGTWTRATA